MAQEERESFNDKNLSKGLTYLAVMIYTNSSIQPEPV